MRDFGFCVLYTLFQAKSTKLLNWVLFNRGFLFCDLSGLREYVLVVVGWIGRDYG